MSEFTTLFSFIMSPAEIKPSLTGELTQQQVFKLDHRETDVALKADAVHVRRVWRISWTHTWWDLITDAFVELFKRNKPDFSTSSVSVIMRSRKTCCTFSYRLAFAVFGIRWSSCTPLTANICCYWNLAITSRCRNSPAHWMWSAQRSQSHTTIKWTTQWPICTKTGLAVGYGR